MNTMPVRLGRSCLLVLAALLAATGHAQFNSSVNNNTVTITGYTGPGGVVAVPSTLGGYPVTTIAANAFAGKSSITSLSLPGTVTYLGDYAIYDCTGLTNLDLPGSIIYVGSNSVDSCYNLRTVTLGNGLPIIQSWMFDNDYLALNSVVIPNSVTSIGPYAFRECSALTNIIFSASLTNIGISAFDTGYALISAYFLGNAPSAPANLFSQYPKLTVYYLPHTTGWSNTFAGAPTALWTPPLPPLGIIMYSGCAALPGPKHHHQFCPPNDHQPRLRQLGDSQQRHPLHCRADHQRTVRRFLPPAIITPLVRSAPVPGRSNAKLRSRWISSENVAHGISTKIQRSSFNIQVPRLFFRRFLRGWALNVEC